MNRSFLKLAASLAILGSTMLGATSSARANEYPSKPITMVVPYPAGQSVDILARVIGEGMSRHLGQPVIIENRAGAGGTIGTQYLTRMAPDGYSIMMGSSGILAIAPQLFKSAGYDPTTDFTPIMDVAAVAQTMVVTASSDFHSVADVIAAAKANPDQINFGSPGNGSTSHLTQEMFKQRAGVQMLHIPYKGGAAAITDLIGGQISVLFEASPTVKAFIDRGDLRALAVTTSEPVPALPDVVPLARQGFDNFEAIGWMGVVGPAGVEPAVVKKLHAALAQTLQDPATKSKLDDLGMLTIGDTPEQFATFIDSEYKKWGDVIRRANVQVQ